MSTKQKGFTLIELLVVISIIGLLASVVLVSLNNARISAREVTRKANLRQLKSALELYYNDNAGYPSTGGAWWGLPAAYGSHGTSGPTGYVPNLAPQYVAQLPLDSFSGKGNLSWNPVCDVNNTGYFYNSNGTDYKLNGSCLLEKQPVATDPFLDPVRPTLSWSIYSSGAINW